MWSHLLTLGDGGLYASRNQSIIWIEPIEISHENLNSKTRDWAPQAVAGTGAIRSIFPEFSTKTKLKPLVSLSDKITHTVRLPHLWVTIWAGSIILRKWFLRDDHFSLKVLWDCYSFLQRSKLAILIYILIYRNIWLMVILTLKLFLVDLIFIF